MFYGASNLIFEKAKALRQNLTQAELLVWGYLKNNPGGYKFRRQHPLGIYIVDFYCHKLKLVIEVDGNIHNKPEVANLDKERQKLLEDLGLKVIRFSNKEVESGMEKVINKIEETLK